MADPRDEAPKTTVHQPFDIEVEQALLGCLIRDSALVAQAAQVVDEDHFYDPLHSRIYATIIAWSQEDRLISAITLAAEMKSDPGITETGSAYFRVLALAAPALPNVRDLARIIRDLSQRRDALWALDQAIHGHHPDADAGRHRPARGDGRRGIRRTHQRRRPPSCRLTTPGWRASGTPNARRPGSLSAP
jgi:hypothetical protein